MDVKEINWDSVPFDEDPYSIFKYGFLEKFKSDLKVKTCFDEEYRMIAFKFYYKGIDITAKLTEEALAEHPTIIKDAEEEIVKALTSVYHWSIVEAVSEIEQKRFSSCRKGQALFNALYKLFPEVADKIRATKDDCFYDDSKIKEFKSKAIRLLRN